ncbi:MAG: hypothetical protein CME65_13365 [Halobacteriovoraceae bacterium]|nr:hypothetical protein [Halobacteriovoraceae bacterium]|tara:strand:+ start:23390 stop:24058 length:669 start_codon:yes stop_codon:yes gene_type:complete
MWAKYLFLFLISTSLYAKYPDKWWRPVAQSELASWEIGPQGGTKDVSVILSKRNELGILSNFAKTPFVLDGKRYPGVEGFWQSLKFPENDKDIRTNFTNWKYSRSEVGQMSGFEAKAAGDYATTIMRKNKIDWVTFKGRRLKYWTDKKGEHYKLILRAMQAKLEQNPEVKEILMSTKDLILLPDHKTKPTDPPAWKYNKIWMKLRKNLQIKENSEASMSDQA